MKKLFRFEHTTWEYDVDIGAVVIANDLETAWEMVKDMYWPTKNDEDFTITEFDLNHAVDEVVLTASRNG